MNFGAAGSWATAQIQECDSFSQYVRECTLGIEHARALPVYTGRARDYDPLTLEPMLRAARAFSPTCPTVVVAAGNSPIAVCAVLLAAGIGGRIELVDAVTDAWSYGHQSACLVAPIDVIGDRLIAPVLDASARSCRGERPWELDSRHTFVTAEDVAGISRLVARLIRATHAPELSQEHLHLIVSDSGVTRHSVLPLATPERTVVETVPAEGVEAVLSEARGILAFHGHGGDSCAYAGDVSVLCGLRSSDDAQPTRATLACRNENVGCLRGPRPLAMATLPARHVMQASCSSARLGNSVITFGFNLFLSFVDGGGVTYAGTATGGGGPEAGMLYLSALAEGQSFGSALSLVNAFLERSGIDEPVYIGIGLPELTITRPRTGVENEPAAVAPSRGNGLVSLDLGERRFATFLLDHETALEHAAVGRLGLAIRAESDVLWFHRLEAVPDEPSRGGDPDGRRLRLFLFSFPGPLGRVELTPIDRVGKLEDLGNRLAALQRWLQYQRLFFGVDADGFQEGIATYARFQDTLGTVVDRLRYDGSMAHLLADQCAVITETCRAFRDLLLLQLERRITGSFWLTNDTAREHLFTGSDWVPCPGCGRHSSRRRLSSTWSEDVRTVIICMRCGIVEDIRANGGIRRIEVEVPESVVAGLSLPVHIEIESAPEHGKELVILAAISGPSCPPIIARREVRSNGAVASLAVGLEIPADLPDYEYRLKCLVANDEDITFVSRVICVRSPVTEER